MTVEEIVNRLNRIKQVSYDGEVAHELQDDLFIEFIRYVEKKSRGQLSVRAKLVLNVLSIKFDRWYA